MRIAVALLSCASLALAGNLFARQAICTSDDACESVCRAAPCSGTLDGKPVSPSNAVVEKARSLYSDYHCVSGKCQCAITSDDQAEELCKYWVEHDKADFPNARYVSGGVNADKGMIYCVFASNK
ncbi:hypothetical protein CERZMDRAFT_100198 [Cercospora zeae-maydis SCOH1-5]|uniref:Uncharacterized protein n=1 Tax=Cercospora zeae-maydis SCOH1-5 TaxID=717836 RepID=A0A6A6F8R9_9PEZI|nr:hypothetical protein CERZMDRAFT_100198 [Cercospora zeae-maydis SCOH1-5]